MIGFTTMSRKASRFNLPTITLTIFFLIATVAYSVDGLESRKLDESTTPGDQGVKCTPSCVQSPPPPSPPLPPPPPPPSPPVVKPPTPKKPPSNKYCPPPPNFIYITGPPGNLYPIDENFGGANRNLEVGLLALVSGFLVLLAF